MYLDSSGVGPPWFVACPLLEDLVNVLETRLLKKLGALEQPPGRPGSKQAVLRHFGIFRDDPGLQQMLDDIYARRKGRGEAGEE